MSLWTCLACTTRYAVGMPACPHCTSVDHTDDPDGLRPEAATIPAPPPAKASIVKTPSGSD
jgi:hypothetical protein